MSLSIWTVLFVLLPLLGGLAAIYCGLANRIALNRTEGKPLNWPSNRFRRVADLRSHPAPHR